MAKKRKPKKRSPAPSRPQRQVVAPAPASAAAEEQMAADAEQRASVRRTTARLVLFCVLVALATAAILIAQAGPSGGGP